MYTELLFECASRNFSIGWKYNCVWIGLYTQRYAFRCVCTKSESILHINEMNNNTIKKDERSTNGWRIEKKMCRQKMWIHTNQQLCICESVLFLLWLLWCYQLRSVCCSIHTILHTWWFCRNELKIWFLAFESAKRENWLRNKIAILKVWCFFSFSFFLLMSKYHKTSNQLQNSNYTDTFNFRAFAFGKNRPLPKIDSNTEANVIRLQKEARLGRRVIK